MNAHLDELELTAAVAGLDLEPAAAAHLAACAPCRRRVETTAALLEQSRLARTATEPDWDLQRRAILERLPRRTGLRLPPLLPWWRPLLAVAAVLALAVTVTLVRPGSSVPAARADIPVEQILAEVDAALDGPAIPGFGPLDSLVPGVDGMDDLEGLLVNGES
jgi:hypothetical protein